MDEDEWLAAAATTQLTDFLWLVPHILHLSLTCFSCFCPLACLQYTHGWVWLKVVRLSGQTYTCQHLARLYGHKGLQQPHKALVITIVIPMGNGYTTVVTNTFKICIVTNFSYHTKRNSNVLSTISSYHNIPHAVGCFSSHSLLNGAALSSTSAASHV